MSMLARLYRKAGPHEALIVYGFRIEESSCQAGGRLYSPWWRPATSCRSNLCRSMWRRTRTSTPSKAWRSRSKPWRRSKLNPIPKSIWTASEQFLTKSDQEREGLIKLVMEGHLRGIIGQFTVEEIVKQPEMVGDRMRSTCADDMNKMGLEVISFTIKEVRDKNEYIINMGKPDIARIKRDADVATAEADRDTAIRALAHSRSCGCQGASRPGTRSGRNFVIGQAG